VLAFYAVGLGVIVLGVVIMVNARRFRRRAVRVPGRIVAMRVRGSMYYPVVAFTTLDGRYVETGTNFGSSPPPGRVGDAVYVLYDPADPARARVDSLSGRGTLFGALFVAFGVVFTAMATLLSLPA